MNARKHMNFFRNVLILTAALFLWNPLSGTAMPGAGGAPGADAAGGPSLLAVTGKVVETMDSGGYTYALVNDKDGLKTWVAMPKTTITKGSEITCFPGMVMTNFNSSSLKRTFERIVFSQGLSAAPTAAK